MTGDKPDDFEALKTIADALQPFSKEDQERILRWTQEKFALRSITGPSPTYANLTVTPASTPERVPGRTQDIRSFIASKNPQSDNQFVTAVAYFYRFEAPEAERKTDITGEIIQEATRLAGRARLGDPAKTLQNAHSQGYLDKISRGRYAITTVGENLVAMTLPQGENKATRGTVKLKRKPGKGKNGKRK